MNSKGMKISMSIIMKNNDEEELVSETIKEKGEDENKYNTVSLKEIKDVLGVKVNESQKKSMVKEILTNIFIAIIMVTYLIIVIMGSSNIDIEIFEKDIKVMTLSILAIGIFILEMSYKKDNIKVAMYGIEVLIFGASNLCLIYVIKLYLNNLINIITYIGIGVAVYYILKSVFIAIGNTRKYKKDNNDIKEIVKKK